MKNAISKAYYKMYDNLGLAKYDKIFFKFMVSHILFNIFQALPSVFINTFFLSKTDDATVAMMYNLINYAGVALFMQIGQIITRKFSPGVCASVGLVVYNIFYVLLLVLSDHAVQYFWLFGIVSGMGGAFYWLSYGQRFISYTNNGNRENAGAIFSIFGSIVSLIFPMISAVIITSFAGDLGYLIVFAIALVVSIITTIKLIQLPKTKMPKRDIPLYKCIKATFKTKLWFFSFLATSTHGFREGAFSFILSIVVYQFVKSEMLVGINGFLCSIGTILASILMSKFTRKYKSNNTRVFQIAFITTILSIACTSMIFYPNFITVMIFSFFNAFLFIFVTIPINATHMLPFGTIPNAFNYAPEMLAIKECFVAGGRCLGIFLLVILNAYFKDNFVILAVILLGLTLVQYLSAWICKKANDEALKIQEYPEEFVNYLQK